MNQHRRTRITRAEAAAMRANMDALARDVYRRCPTGMLDRELRLWLDRSERHAPGLRLRPDRQGVAAGRPGRRGIQAQYAERLAELLVALAREAVPVASESEHDQPHQEN